MTKEKFSNQLYHARLMIDGLKQNSSNLPAGIDEHFLRDFETLKTETERLDSLQEKLKADLKTATAQLNEKLTELKKKQSEAAKRIKMDFEQARWKEFGLDATR